MYWQLPTTNRPSRRKVALQEAFEYVPTKFINEKFKEHGHYYGTFFALLEAERSLIPPFVKLKARRVTHSRTSVAMMIELRAEGYEFEELKMEIDSAQQRRKRDEGTPHGIIL